MFEELKAAVCWANRELPRYGLVTLTWGNVSGIDDNREHLVIKPSGVSYDRLVPEDMVVVRIADGAVVEGRLRPSSDTPVHRVLYRHFDDVGGIVHTHSAWATAWAQAGREIPVLGTTHADFCPVPVPCTRDLTAEEAASEFEWHTGLTIVEALRGGGHRDVPAILVRGHGPFCWGEGPMEAVNHAVILEEVAKIAHRTLALNPRANLNPAVANRHFARKHGPDAYYGQER